MLLQQLVSARLHSKQLPQAPRLLLRRLLPPPPSLPPLAAARLACVAPEIQVSPDRRQPFPRALARAEGPTAGLGSRAA